MSEGTKAILPVISDLIAWQAWQDRATDDSMGELCGHVVSGGHLAGFCKERGLPYTSMGRWLNSDATRADMYARAREDRSDLLADEILAISDDTSNDTYIDDKGISRVDQEAIARSRLRVDSRKWLAAKLKPRIYGDKLDVVQAVTVRDVSDESIRDRLAALGVTIAASLPLQIATIDEPAEAANEERLENHGFRPSGA